MPELGSFVDNGSYKRTLMGLSSDIPTLQSIATAKPDAFLTGEVAYCVDTKATYIYERTTATWYPQQ